MDKFSERLMKVLMDLCWTNYRLAKECGFSKSSVSNWLKDVTKPDDSKLEVIARVTGINKDWLKNGGKTMVWDRFDEIRAFNPNGPYNEDGEEVIVEDFDQEQFEKEVLRYYANEMKDYIEGDDAAEIIARQMGKSIEEIKAVLSSNKAQMQNIYETRPRVPLTAAAGSLSVAPNGVTLKDCEQMPLIHQFPDYDFTMFIKGDSMSPRFESGDEIACRHIDQSRFIQWGKVHVLDTTQGFVIKRVYEDGDKIRCVSYNPDYSDFSVPKEDILSMSLVVGVVSIMEM